MSEEFPQGAHDAWLAGYFRSDTEVWCANPACVNHQAPVTVTIVTENGQSWCEPESCDCHGRWLDEPPTEGEDDDDDQ
jgi:hypothetical protein